MKLPPWLRRLVTRAIAIVPAAIVTIWYGESGTARLLILTQVVLSLQLSFAVFPLVMFTADKAKMGELVAPRWSDALLVVPLDDKVPPSRSSSKLLIGLVNHFSGAEQIPRLLSDCFQFPRSCAFGAHLGSLRQLGQLRPASGVHGDRVRAMAQALLARSSGARSLPAGARRGRTGAVQLIRLRA
jgi:hypothetical protein